jgi:hypothetical protein
MIGINTKKTATLENDMPPHPRTRPSPPTIYIRGGANSKNRRPNTPRMMMLLLIMAEL